MAGFRFTTDRFGRMVELIRNTGIFYTYAFLEVSESERGMKCRT